MNETERELMPELADAALVAVTYGAEGAALFRGGEEIARANGVPTRAVNTVGAGDAFCAALVLALQSGLPAQVGPADGLRGGALPPSRTSPRSLPSTRSRATSPAP
ncbi:PfkB family carbohydrate kinase [Microbacterium sp. NRRL B-14842]|uniref:PfkB family carbohydrate kinase n=1 Tax=Microbacterium sp. NRRL B-14842 TaxID=3162881 RepID=UPI003D27BD2B